MSKLSCPPPPPRPVPVAAPGTGTVPFLGPRNVQTERVALRERRPLEEVGGERSAKQRGNLMPAGGRGRTGRGHT